MQDSTPVQAQSSESDDVIAVWSSYDCKFSVKGNPKTQLRYNIGRGGNSFDPSKKDKLAFRSKVEEMLSLHGNQLPHFPSSIILSITVIFRIRRPNNHFVGNKRESATLKTSAPPPLSVTKCDVDNLVKFVMDALNTLLYEDDKQVAAVHAFRLYDSDGTCEGSTAVHLTPIVNAFPSCDGIIM
jgi:Holliday junction resolvase RusA-like endonuclease